MHLPSSFPHPLKTRNVTLCIFSLFLLTSTLAHAQSSYQEEVLADGPVAYWNFDELEDGTTDSFPEGSNLYAVSQARKTNPLVSPPPSPQLTSAMEFVRTSNRKYAFRIDHDRVGPLNPSASEGQSFTIEAWIRPTAPVFAAGADKAIVSLDHTDSPSGYFFFHTQSGRLLFQIKKSGSSGSLKAKSYPGVITLDEWQHVAVAVTPTLDATTVRFFHNGRPVAAEIDTLQPMNESEAGIFWIGDRHGNHGVYHSFEGTMDEVAFYPSALSEDRILTHYGLGSTITGDRWQTSRGHELVLAKGLQMQTWMEWYIGQRSNGLSPQRWQDLGTTTQFIYFDPALWQGDPAGGWATQILEGGIARDSAGQLTGDVLTNAQKVHEDRLISLQVGDEIPFDDPAEQVEYVQYLRQLYPDVLSYFNFDGHETDGQIAAFQREADPDLLTYSRYLDPTASTRPIYEGLAQYRRLAAAGNDGSGASPIPFGQYVRAYNEPRNNRYLGLTGSRIRLSVFSSRTCGAKWISLFKYTGGGHGYLDPHIMLFKEWPDRRPTAAYDAYAEALWQSRRLGPTLTRLQSTDVRFVAGQSYAGGEITTNGLPSGVSAWSSEADPFIDTISVENLGALNDQLPGDVLVGYFSPLQEDADGPYYRDELYFMVLNGLVDHINNAGSTDQLITLELDFGDTGIQGVERLDRFTGEVEDVELTHIDGSRYRMELNLEGGAADLFKLKTGSCFVGIGNCELTSSYLATGSTLEVIEGGVESSYWFSFFTDYLQRMGMSSPDLFYWAEATCFRKTGPRQLIYSAEIQNSSDPSLIGRFVRGFLSDDHFELGEEDRMILEAPDRSSPVDLGCDRIPEEPEYRVDSTKLHIYELY